MLGLGRHTELPLDEDAASRFLPWLVAPMVFLCAVALAGTFILAALIGRWDKDVSGTLTVEIAAAPGDALDSAEHTRQRVAEAVRLLTAEPAVLNARPLSQEQLVALLAPWLGNTDLLKELPLPALIDVTLRPDARPDIDSLSRALTKAVPGASLDDHRVWLARLIGLSRNIEGLAIGIVLLIGGVTAATVYFATRTGMDVHRDVVEVLHLIGATDDYIARQFAARSFSLGLKGGLAGLAATVPILLYIGFDTENLKGGFLADLSLPIYGWAVVICLPALAALLSMLTARITVHRILARLL